MKETLAELNTINGVMGAFISRKSQIIESTMPKVFSTDRMSSIGANISRAFQGSSTQGFNAERLSFMFNNSTLTTSNIDKDSYLSILYGSGANSSLLDISMNIALVDIKNKLLANPPEETRKEPAQVEKAKTEAARPVETQTPQDFLSGSMGHVFNELTDLLSDYLGPVSQIIIIDTLESWIATGRTGLSYLPDFVDMLGEELDAGDRMDFFTRARQIVES